MSPNMPIMGTLVKPKCAHFVISPELPTLGTVGGMRNNLRALRESRGWSQEDVARRMGTTRNQYVKLENGARRLSDKWIERASAAFAVDAGDIVSSREAVVPLVGYVGAGSRTSFFADGDGNFEEVPAPDGSTPKTVAVEIRGDSLGAFFDSWLAFYDDVRDPPSDRMLGKLCVVGLEDGRVLIKKLERGQLPGHYNLLSQFEPPVYDAEVVWAALVKHMAPR